MTTARERKHLARIAAMDCICCKLLGQQQQYPSEVHHIREGQGGAKRAPHHLTIPLCGNDCHRGKNGVHGDRTYLRILRMTELDLLAAVLAELLEAA